MGQLGEGEQVGSVYKQPEREVDDPVTTGGSQVSGAGIQRGFKGETKGNQKGARGSAPCIYVDVMYVPE